MKKMLMIGLLALGGVVNAGMTPHANGVYQNLVKGLGLTNIVCPKPLGDDSTRCATSTTDQSATKAKMATWKGWKQTSSWLSDGTSFTTNGTDVFAVSVFDRGGSALILVTEFPEKKPTKPSTKANIPAKGFRSCAEARAAGFSNIRRGEPAYSKNLDRDGDGIACDK